MLNSLELASQAGRRVYYCPETDTIRQCPEDYCLAELWDGVWCPAVDDESPINEGTIGAAIDRWEGDGPIALAAFIEGFIWGCTDE